MNKKAILMSSLILTTFISVPTVNAADSASARICEYVSVNDKSRLRSFLKSQKLKIRKMFGEIKCNGQNLLVFAASSKSLDTGEFIIGKLPKKIVAANLDAIANYSAHLAEDAKDRIE